MTAGHIPCVLAHERDRSKTAATDTAAVLKYMRTYPWGHKYCLGILPHGTHMTNTGAITIRCFFLRNIRIRRQDPKRCIYVIPGIFCRNQWEVHDKDGNVRAKIATGYFTLFQTWAVLKVKLISILSDSDRIEINFTFRLAHCLRYLGTLLPYNAATTVQDEPHRDPTPPKAHPSGTPHCPWSLIYF